MSSERDSGLHKIGWTAVGDAVGATTLFVSQWLAQAGTVSLFGGLVTIEEGSVLAQVLIGVGAFGGGLALGGALSLGVIYVIAATILSDAEVAGLGGAAEAVGTLTSATGVTLAPYSMLSQGNLDFAGKYSPYGDLGFGIVGAGSIPELIGAGAGFYASQQAAAPPTPSAGTGSSYPNPTPGPAPAPAPTPGPASPPSSFPTPSPNFGGGGGIDPDLYPFAPGFGDSGYVNSSPDSGVTGIFNGGGFNVISNLPASPDPPAVPDPPAPPDPIPPPPPPPDPPPPPPPNPPPPPPPGDDDDDDDDGY